jgi:MoaA/NifB/PqqE/SkfB family radical SAM enzyme
MSEYIDIRRLEFSVTYRCNAHCKHCFVTDQGRRARPEAIDRDLAVNVVRRVAERYAPSSIMTFGGEPLLYPDVTCAIHAAARECEIPRGPLRSLCDP